MRLGFCCKGGLRPPLLEGRVARHVRQQVLAHRLELIPDEIQAQQEDAEVILGAGRIEGALVARRRASVQGLGGEREAERDVGPYLAGV